MARPLASGGGASPVVGGEGGGTPKVGDVVGTQVSSERFGVWEEPRRKFNEISKRAIGGIERLVTSEILEQLRPYVLRRWDNESSPSQEAEEEVEEKEPIPTPSLIPALAIFSSHLGHLCSILDRETLLPVYRHISGSVASALVERVVMAGGSRRFNFEGGMRFERDLKEGWLGVVRELTAAKAGALGRRPEAPWKPALDAARLLTLRSSTGGGKGKEEEVTLAKAVQIVFDAEETGNRGEEYAGLLEGLGVDEGRVNVREVLRRRVEVWK